MANTRLTVKRTRERFENLSAPAIVEVVVSEDEKHPVYIEVQRLKAIYVNLLENEARKLGQCPANLEIANLMPIEKISMILAFRIIERKFKSPLKANVSLH